ncbi:MAG: T9SS type A sorting domain-containing protein, partial [Chlorobi bacterium]|nr:T9SS type A sorting domain-containing protein [Chlorobiota bacterium]
GRTNTYFVQVIDAEGCTGRSNVIKITVLPRPATDIEGLSELCAGTTSSYKLKEFSGNCVWTVENGTINSGQGTDEISVFWEFSGIGKVRAEQPAENGCPGLDSIIVNIIEIPTPQIMPVKKVICADGNLVLYTQENYTDYLWSTGETSASITVAQPGNYSVKVINAGGCSGESEEITVIQTELPIPILTGDMEICPSSETTIGLTDNYESYLWSDGSTNKQITIDIPGDYSVEITDSNGCSNSTDFAISRIIMTIDGIADIDFGDKSTPGLEKEIKLVNNSGRIIHAKNVRLQIANNFTFRTEPLLPCGIYDGDNLHIYVIIDQSSTGIKTDSLFVDFDQPCDTTLSCKLDGNILPRILISLPDKTVEVGEYDEIELSAEVIFGEEQLSGSFSMEYSANHDFFIPEPNPGDVTNKRRTISHSGVATIGLEETKIASNRVLILFSNSDSTDLIIDNFEWTGDPAIIELQDGRLRAKSICVRDLRKIVFFDLPLAISPNPASESLEIKFIEELTGQVLITIHDLTGRTMLNQRYNKTQKEQSFGLDLSTLSSGAYYMSIYIEGRIYKQSGIVVRK